MSFAILAFFQDATQVETTFRQPAYFLPVIVGLLSLGAVLSLVASVLGFARARAFGAPARWFSIGALCLLFFHLQFLALAFGLILKDLDTTFAILTFFNIFILAAAFCAIMGFVRMTSPR